MKRIIFCLAIVLCMSSCVQNVINNNNTNTNDNQNASKATNGDDNQGADQSSNTAVYVDETNVSYTEQTNVVASNVLNLAGTIGNVRCDLYFDFNSGSGTFHQYNSGGTATRTLRLTNYSGSRLEFDAYMNGKYVSHFSGTFNGRTYKGTVRNTKGGVVNFTMHR